MSTPLYSYREYLNTLDEDIVILEPATLDAAILGLVELPDGSSVLCYDRQRIIEILGAHDGMPYPDAADFFDFNIAGVKGSGGPVFLESVADALGLS